MSILTTLAAKMFSPQDSYHAYSPFEIRINRYMEGAITHKKSSLTPILACVSIVAAAGLGGIATSQSISSGWYASLEKSQLNPPNAVFGPVWTFLYVLIALAFCIVWGQAPADRKDYQWAFGVQMALNLLWSVVFFGMRSPVGGIVVIAALIGAIVAMIATYWKYSKVAAWMMVPYLAWVSFATYLNAATVALN
jgi:translocator protein